MSRQTFSHDVFISFSSAEIIYDWRGTSSCRDMKLLTCASFWMDSSDELERNLCLVTLSASFPTVYNCVPFFLCSEESRSTSVAHSSNLAMDEMSVWEVVIEDLRRKLESALPEDWVQRVDTESKLVFFEKIKTGETSWEFPACKRDSSSGIEALQKELEKALLDVKKSTMKEAAMRTDINKFKAEAKQVKKQLNEELRSVAKRKQIAQREAENLMMHVEDQSSKFLRHEAMFIGELLDAIGNKDLEKLDATLKPMMKLGNSEELSAIIGEHLKKSKKEQLENQELMTSQGLQINALSEDLEVEKQRRKREIAGLENDLSSQNENMISLEATLREKEALIRKQRNEMEITFVNHAEEVDNLKRFQNNSTSALQAQLLLAKESHESTLLELAQIWPDDLCPPTLLRNEIIDLRKNEKSRELMEKAKKLKIGTMVQAWDEMYGAYFEGVITARRPETDELQVTWTKDSTHSPKWLHESFCFAIVEDETISTRGTQTDASMFDRASRYLGNKPHSARGRLDKEMEALDSRTRQILAKRASKNMNLFGPELKNVCKAIFKCIDLEKAGEVTFAQTWKAILESAEVRALIANNETTLSSLRRKDYLARTWGKDEEEEEDAEYGERENLLDVALSFEEFYSSIKCLTKTSHEVGPTRNEESLSQRMEEISPVRPFDDSLNPWFSDEQKKTNEEIHAEVNSVFELHQCLADLLEEELKEVTEHEAYFRDSEREMEEEKKKIVLQIQEYESAGQDVRKEVFKVLGPLEASFDFSVLLFPEQNEFNDITLVDFSWDEIESRVKEMKTKHENDENVQAIVDQALGTLHSLKEQEANFKRKQVENTRRLKDFESSTQDQSFEAIFWKDELHAVLENKRRADESSEFLLNSIREFQHQEKLHKSSIRDLLKDGELLEARIFEARAQTQSARNEMERSIAEAHLGCLLKDAKDERSFIKEKLEKEIEIGDTARKKQLKFLGHAKRMLKSLTFAIHERKRLLQLGNIREISEIRKLGRQREQLLTPEALTAKQNWIEDDWSAIFEAHEDLTARLNHQKESYEIETKGNLERQVKHLTGKLEATETRLRFHEDAYLSELHALSVLSENSVALVHEKLETAVSKYKILKRESEERLGMTEEDFASSRRVLAERITGLTSSQQSNRHWILMLQAELQETKSALQSLTRKAEEQERKRASEKDQIRKKLYTSEQHGKRLENWVASMKGEVKMLHKELEEQKENMLRQAESFAEERRWLRLETWARDETARVLSTNLDSIFLFFAETLTRLAGAGELFNNRLAANEGVLVLFALQQSQRPEIQHLATQALSRAAWNDHVDFRVLAQDATENWRKWVHGVSVVSALHTRRKSVPFQGHQLTIRATPFGLEACPREEAESLSGIHHENQKRLGRGLSGQKAGIEILFKVFSASDMEAKVHISKTFSILSLDAENRIRIESFPDAFPILLQNAKICAVDDSHQRGNQEDGEFITQRPLAVLSLSKEEICKNVLDTIANLIFNSVENQAKFANVGGIAQILNICRDSQNADIILGCTAILLNACSLEKANVHRIASEGGLQALLGILDESKVKLGTDEVTEEMKRNAVETIMNISTELKAEVLLGLVAENGELDLKPLITLCTSRNMHLKRSGAIILGNLGNDHAIRERIGEQGGIEILFTIADCKDNECKIHALRSLGNLAWNAANQNRIGKFLPQLITHCEDEELQVRENAANALANALFYHEGNRRRFGFFTKAITCCARLLADVRGQSTKVHENIARVLGSAAYNDAVALQTGLAGCIPSLLEICRSNPEDNGIQRSCCFALANLAVHDVHKTQIIRENGVETITRICGSGCPETSRHADKVLEILADMSKAGEIAARREQYGMKGLIDLLFGEEEYHGQSQLQKGMQGSQALAIDELGTMCAESDTRRREFLRYEGHKAVLQLLGQDSCEDQAEKKLAQRCLWICRNLMQKGGIMYQDIMGAHHLHMKIIKILSKHFQQTEKTEEDQGLVRHEDLCEAALACLFTFVSNHKTNSRRVLSTGLRNLVMIAEASKTHTINSELAASVLQMMGPHAWIVCSNCKSNERSGSTCSNCGRVLINSLAT